MAGFTGRQSSERYGWSARDADLVKRSNAIGTEHDCGVAVPGAASGIERAPKYDSLSSR